MVTVRYSEYDATHRGDFIHDYPDGLDCWLLLMTHTPAVFLVGEKYEECPPNTIFIFKPHQRIYYRACGIRYANDWMHFETDENFLAETFLPAGVPLSADDPVYIHKLFQLITMENDNNGKYNDVIIEKLFQIMFQKLYEHYEPEMTYLIIHDIYDLRREIFSNPDQKWTLSIMADKLNISSGHLENLYKNTFGVSCMEDVIKSRISLAKKYLKSSNYSISEIIPLCGYHSSEHFYRQFKKITGMTPRGYRTKLSNHRITVGR